MNDKVDINARRKARSLAVQAVYQWQLSAYSSSQIEKQFSDEGKLEKADNAYFCELLRKITDQQSLIDDAFKDFLDRKLHELNPVELAILRIATYELVFRKEIPYRVVINEALALTKKFGANEAYKYVNAVLDKVAKVTREHEFEE